MPLTMLVLLIFVVALVYASVGHGGASGYLAVMALLAYAPRAMSSSALLLNLLVSGIAWIVFWRAGHGSWRLLGILAATSVPAALLGGWLPVSSRMYGWLLAGVLLLAAARLAWPDPRPVPACAPPSAPVTLAVGGGLGLLSGIVGVGGGIFLSPLLVLLRWADVKRTAAVSAAFIWINSAAGLMGRLLAGRLEAGPMVPLVVSACLGGLLGSWLGAHRLPNLWLRRLLAGVLALASCKLAVAHG